MNDYIFHLLCLLGIYATAAMSLNLVVGGSGLISLAHAAYFAVGAYSYAIASLHGMGFLPALFATVALAVVLSLALSIPSWRFRGDFFVLVSLAVQALVFSLIYNWHSPTSPVGSWPNLTNGPYGITGVPRPEFFGIELNSTRGLAFLSVALAGVCAGICSLLLKSPWWRMITATRDDEVAARSIWKNVRLAKVQVFAIASGMVAAAGAVYASYFSYVNPDAASLPEGILLLSMVLVGGTGNFLGPLVGAGLLVGIPELLRLLAMPSSVAANVRLLLYGLLLVIFMHFRGRGIAGEYRIE